jgi:hypothetical protein
MALDFAVYRQKLLDRRVDLCREKDLAEGDRAP